MRNLRLEGLFTLRAPLSHIGEALSTTTYLVQEPVLQPDGSIEEVFVYSGNAWRGQLRDLAAQYMLDALDRPILSLDAFHLLFSGGRIGGAQSTDLDQARRMRRAIPALAIFGGGVGNQILEGKLRVSGCYPLCREAMTALPRDLHAAAAPISYRGLTFEKSHSRRDDSRVEAIAGYLPAPALAAIEGDPKARRKSADDQPQQMRFTSELLAAGTRLYSRIDVIDASDEELGCLVSALHRFSASPHIGGQIGRGYGRVALDYTYLDLDSGEAGPFLRIEDGPSLLSPPAAAAKDAYDQHLRGLYDALIAERDGEIRALLGAA